MEQSRKLVDLKERSLLHSVVECHRKAFPKSFTTQLGRKYLTKMFEWYLDDQNRFLLVLFEDTNCVGYCGGFIKKDGQIGSTSGMIQHTFDDAVKALFYRPWLLFHVEIRRKYRVVIQNIRNRFFPQKKNLPSQSNVCDQMPASSLKASTGLVVIGVNPDHRRKGFGTRLLEAFEDKATKMGVNRMHLSVRSKNKAAIKAYERNGWSRTKVNGDSLEMIKIISD